MAKAPPKKEEKNPEADAEGEDQQPKKKGKLPLILGLVALLAAAGGGAWFFMFKDKEADVAAQQTKPKPPVFVPLDVFTVKLAADQSDQYLQVVATLKVLDQPSGDAVKLHMPEIRHRTLILLSSKTAASISSAEGQERLAEEIRQTANNILLAAAGRPVKPVVPAAPLLPAAAPAAEAKPGEPVAEPAKPAEGGPPQDGSMATEAPVAPPAAPPAAPPTADPARPATTLPTADADDPVQSVFFTSFIIQ